VATMLGPIKALVLAMLASLRVAPVLASGQP